MILSTNQMTFIVILAYEISCTTYLGASRLWPQEKGKDAHRVTFAFYIKKFGLIGQIYCAIPAMVSSTNNCYNPNISISILHTYFKTYHISFISSIFFSHITNIRVVLLQQLCTANYIASKEATDQSEMPNMTAKLCEQEMNQANHLF